MGGVLVADALGEVADEFEVVGDGSFRPIATFDAGSGPASLQLVDVNGDGDVEAVVTNEADNEISVIPEPTALAAALAALLTMAGLRRLQGRRF